VHACVLGRNEENIETAMMINDEFKITNCYRKERKKLKYSFLNFFMIFLLHHQYAVVFFS
jgi:hypothetical protein